MIPWLALAGISAGGNILSNLLAPGKSTMTAGDIRSLLEKVKYSGMQQIQSGVNAANESAAAQAAQSGISSPNFLTRMIGMNELRGGQMGAQLESDIAGRQLSGMMDIGQMNLAAGQRKAFNLGETFGYIADPLASMATLQYMVNDPRMLSMIRGEV